jgi:hypothetical protein
MEHHAYIRRETCVSMAINTALTLAFFLAVFGRAGPVPVWTWVRDFLPQGFMIALMATLVPGALAGKALRAGRLAPLDRAGPLPRNLFARALLLALASALAAAALAAAFAALTGLATLAYATALGIKLAFAAGLAALITPAGLRAALGTPAIAR